MRNFDAHGDNAWLSNINHTQAVRDGDRYYPPKHLLAFAIRGERRGGFNTA